MTKPNRYIPDAANPLLSSKTDQWNTPSAIIDLVHHVMPIIDLDPASCSFANKTVQAREYFSKEDDALTMSYWSLRPVSVFLNPPSGRVDGKSKPFLFWQKLMGLRQQGLLTEAIFLAFSLEQLATLQSCNPSLCDFTLCIPRKRIRFVSKEGTFNSPTHSNAIVYVHGLVDNTPTFVDVFSSLGSVMYPKDRV